MGELVSTYVKWPMKDVHDDLDYAALWASWLDPGDYIVESRWRVPSGMRAHDDSISADGKSTIVWISGGENVPSQPAALVQNSIRTAGGRVCTKTIALPLGPS